MAILKIKSIFLLTFLLVSCGGRQGNNNGIDEETYSNTSVTISSFVQAEAWMLAEGQRQERCRNDLYKADKNSPQLKELLICALGREEAEQILEFPDENVPDIQDPGAAKRLQEFYSSSRFRRCESLTSLLRAKDDGRVRIENSSITREVANEHRDACFRSGLELPKAIFSRLAVLGKFSGNYLEKIVCMGVLLPDGRVATAKHCFFDLDVVNDFRRLHDSKDRKTALTVDFSRVSSDFRIFLPGLSSSALSFEFDNFQPAIGEFSYIPNHPLSDLVILQVKGNFSKNIGSLGSARQFDQMVVAGFYPGSDLNPIREAIGSENFYNELSKLIIFDDTLGCFIVDMRNDCILHVCQTFGGFSGTPMFHNDGKRYNVIGLHLGSLGSSDNLCEYRRSATVPNRGVKILDILVNQ